MSGLTMGCLVLQELLELVITCYSQNLLVLPFFRRRRWKTGIVIYIVQLFVIIGALPYMLNGVGYIFGTLFHVTDLVDWRQEHIAFSVTAFTIVATFVKTGVDRLIRDKEQKEVELRRLREQLNPHFLFNTLNNLYGLAVGNSDKLPSLMLKLSDLLRYSLYDTGQPYVPLQNEIEYISNYVDLERIRLNDKAKIVFIIEGETDGLYIAPLLMVVFVENAFKHFSSSRETDAFINIRVLTQNDRLRLTVKNSVASLIKKELVERQPGGLGLKNVRQRLKLIYPGQFELAINKMPDTFETDLIIELA